MTVKIRLRNSLKFPMNLSKHLWLCGISVNFGRWDVARRRESVCECPTAEKFGVESPYVQSENGLVYIAPGGIPASGQVRIYKKIDSPNDISGQEEWELVQVINSPTISNDFSASCNVPQRNVFRERFGFDVSLSEDGLVLLVGSRGGERPFFERCFSK